MDAASGTSWLKGEECKLKVKFSAPQMTEQTISWPRGHQSNLENRILSHYGIAWKQALSWVLVFRLSHNDWECGFQGYSGVPSAMRWSVQSFGGLRILLLVYILPLLVKMCQRQHPWSDFYFVAYHCGDDVMTCPELTLSLSGIPIGLRAEQLMQTVKHSRPDRNRGGWALINP